MPQYVVLQPCIYANADGTATQHLEEAVGIVVELPTETAEALGAAVKPLVSAAPPDLAPTRHVPRRAAGEAPGDGG